MSGILGQITSGISATNRLAQTVGSTVTDVAKLGQTLGLSGAVDNTGLSFTGGSWFQQLQPGSWRGVGFVLDAGDVAAGRRVALHEYPYRDDVWPEDLGKLPRRFSINAFLTGDDVYQQRDAMLAAVEQAGPGTLVHPTLGSVQCVLLEFQCSDRRERGRFVELQFAFVIASTPLLPISAIATGTVVSSAAAALNLASKGDLGGALAAVTSTVHTVTGAVGQFTSIAGTMVNDASRVFNAVRGVAGYFGRFATGSRSSLQSPLATVQSALGLATAARTTVNSAIDLVNHTASLL